MVKRRGINSVATVWAADDNHAAARSEAVLAVDLLLAAVDCRRLSPDVDLALAGLVVVGALLAVVLVWNHQHSLFSLLSFSLEG